MMEREMLREALELADEAIQQVSREPLGKGAVTGFDVVASGDTGGAGDAGDAGDTGEPPTPLRYYVDTSRLAVTQETGLVLGPLAAPDVRIWLHPADPHLPTLPAVAFHHAAESLLSRIGLSVEQPPEFVGYRPGRRAVLRMVGADSAGSRAVWVKIVRPSRAARIAGKHEACERAGLPVPSLEAWSPDGVMLIADAVGTPAADILARGADGAAELFLDRIDELIEQFAGVEVSEPARGVADRLDWYAERLADSTLSEPALGDSALGNSTLAREVAQAARDIFAKVSGAESEAAVARPAAPRPKQVIHGDLHFGQLFLDDAGGVSGVIDVDTLGVGDPAEDPAAFIAHATASALMTAPQRRQRVWDLADGAVRRWGDDPMVLGLFAVHMLGHAGGAIERGDELFATQLLRVAVAVLGGAAPSAAAPSLHDH